jgi:O-antigen biosynthesis protein WbqV
LLRNTFIIGHDAAMAFIAMTVAFWLRYESSGIDLPHTQVIPYATLFALVALFVVCALRTYRDTWRYTSLSSMWKLLQASVFTTLLFSLAAFLLTRTEHVPRSVPLIASVLFAGFLAVPRVARRLSVEGDLFQSAGAGRVPVVLIGAGAQADSFMRAMRRRKEAPYSVEGLLSQDPGLKGCLIQGVMVLGTPVELQSAVNRLKARGRIVQRVIFTGDEAYSNFGAQVLDDSTKLGLSIARLPRLAELRDGLGSELETRPVAIEDLLGRPQVRIDEARLSSLIAGRRVLVTGAGGSIGSELVRQIARHAPAKIILLDYSEFNLYRIDQRLTADAGHVARRAGLCDVRDKRAIQKWFEEEKPEVVFHAAALKHVPIVEQHASDAVLTNVVGTRHVAEAAREFGAAVMVLISSDKAVNPANVMGATKRVAESFCQALDETASTEAGKATTRYVTVRFGNVLGSSGSVVPLFQEQLARGGPLTVTHPEVCRYFMTIPEAVQLVLQASAAAVAERSGIGQIFVLDMGKPIRIVELARQMIRLSGKRPDVDVKIEYVGLRPGEKLFEELAYGDEGLSSSSVPGVLLARPAVCDMASMDAQLRWLEAAARNYQDGPCLELLRGMIPEFTSSSMAA